MLKLIKKYKYIITIVIILIVICLVFVRSKVLKSKNSDFIIEKNDVIASNDIENVNYGENIVVEDNINSLIKVDIKGQVVNPGVYELDNNSRVIDVINLAGGVTDIANTSLINLSKKIEDQMVIIIYSEEEVMNSNIKEIETVFKIVEKECICPAIENDGCINTELNNSDTSTEKDTINSSKKININTASIDELLTLDGVGESKAKAIIEYREKNKFNSIEDIKNVSGIGESAFEKIREYITV